MRTFGATFEYMHERNRELLLAFRSLLHQGGVRNLKTLCEQLASRPCSRFWVSPERAAQVVYRMEKGDTLSEMRRPERRAMFREIYRRTMKIKKREPSRSLTDIVSEVVCQKAPSFYLTPKSVRVLLVKAKKQWKEEHLKSHHS